jgi:glycosyltransferase involved in cell wall biosynthesis
MRTIVFLDLVCPKPYSLRTLETEPLGGSEATAIRVAHGLAASGFLPVIAQHNRTEAETQNGVRYIPFEGLEGLKRVAAAIAFRRAETLPFIQKTWPDAKRFLWVHDFNTQHLVEEAELLRGAKVLCVSRTHKTVTTGSLLRQLDDTQGITVDFVYNPLDEDLKADDTPVNPSRYVFFSSPHKGLEHTLKIFERVREFDKDAELRVANPGYLPDRETWPAGVVNLGPLPHHKIIQEVRSAQCVLNLNDVFPETFGIVFSEASAVGTPTLTAPIGAAREILGDREQTVDVRNEKAVIDRLLKWRESRPKVQANPEFRLSNVIAKWKDLIG